MKRRAEDDEIVGGVSIDFWRSLLKTLKGASTIGILEQQIQYLDTLSLIRLMKVFRLMKEYKEVKSHLENSPTIWDSRLHRLERKVNSQLTQLKDYYNIRIVAGTYQNADGQKFPLTLPWNAFTFNVPYMTFCLAWAQYGHVWLPPKTEDYRHGDPYYVDKNIIMQDWDADIKFPIDWTENEKALFFRANDPRSDSFFRWAVWNGTPPYRFMRLMITPDEPLPECISKDCKLLEKLIETKVKNLTITPILQVSLRSIPTFGFSTEPYSKRFRKYEPYYANQYESKIYDVPLFALTVVYSAGWRIYAFDGTKFFHYDYGESGKRFDMPIMPGRWNYNPSVQDLYLPSFVSDIPLDFRITLTIIEDQIDQRYSNAYAITWHPLSEMEQIMGEFPEHHPPKRMDPAAWARGDAITGVFKFRPKFLLLHETTDRAITIESRICSNCNLPAPTFMCGNECQSAYYCNQECADSHYDEHKPHCLE